MYSTYLPTRTFLTYLRYASFLQVPIPVLAAVVWMEIFIFFFLRIACVELIGVLTDRIYS